MIRWIEDKENNRVYREDIRVSNQGNIFKSTRFDGPYWCLSISGPEKAKINDDVQFVVSVINWKGEDEAYKEPVDVNITIYRDGEIEKEMTITVQDKATFTIPVEHIGNYTIRATYQDWKEGAWALTIE